MQEPLQHLQAHLLRHHGGDRVLAQVLMAIPLHGLDDVLVAVELALQSGRVSADHVLNVLATRVRHQNADFAFLVKPLPCESTTYAHFCGSFVVATA